MKKKQKICYENSQEIKIESIVLFEVAQEDNYLEPLLPEVDLSKVKCETPKSKRTDEMSQCWATHKKVDLME